MLISKAFQIVIFGVRNELNGQLADVELLEEMVAGLPELEYNTEAAYFAVMLLGNIYGHHQITESLSQESVQPQDLGKPIAELIKYWYSSRFEIFPLAEFAYIIIDQLCSGYVIFFMPEWPCQEEPAEPWHLKPASPAMKTDAVTKRQKIEQLRAMIRNVSVSEFGRYRMPPRPDRAE